MVRDGSDVELAEAILETVDRWGPELTVVALGPLTVRMMEDIHVHQTILSVGGITAKGLFNSNLLLAETERQMMSCADEVVYIAWPPPLRYA